MQKFEHLPERLFCLSALLAFILVPASVLAQANFEVTLDATNAPIVEGATLEVTATIDNTGDQLGSEEIALDVGGALRDSTSLALAAGGSQTTTLTWNTGVGDAGDYSAVVASEDDSASRLISVLAEAHFAVGVDGTNAPVFEGETLEVTATIDNTGDQSDTQEVTLDVGGVQRDSVPLTLSGGESQMIALEWATAVGDAGDYSAVVASEDDSGSASASVLALPDEIFKDRFESQ